ncbi:DEAD/DEAH box helicase [Bradyrhizobium aeschynomenes]|uniref:DEAD/DEAH box helicase n=1 Tax=Bradyrhizobium aeschynomenes TaxID=2734909 RepID=UPI0015516CA8|nr:DEAD/DEAH box helicase [Bradyrhizobium aeschynomenes]NPV21002.1 DEAD/DEAH box helicase [Bradyrhizobium aeschynomenes]
MVRSSVTPKSQKADRSRSVAAGTAPARARPSPSSDAPLGLLALHLLSERQRRKTHGLIFIADNEPRAERLAAVLHAMDPGCDVLVLPRFDTLPFDDAEPSREVAGRRTHVLRRLAERASAPLLISTVEAMLPRVPPPRCWTDWSLRVATDQSIDVEAFRKALVASGYDPDEPSDHPGGLLCHGQTTELFPAGALGPVRISHADGVVSDIHFFDPVHQNQIAAAETLVIDPMSEREIGDEAARIDIFDYLDGADIIVDTEVPQRADLRHAALDENAPDAARRQRGFIGRDAWQHALGVATVLPKTSDLEPIPRFAEQKSARNTLRRFIASCHQLGLGVIFTAGTPHDLARMERLAGVKAERCANWAAAMRASRAGVAALMVDLERGFRTGTTQPLSVITAAEVLGSRARHLQPMTRQQAAHGAEIRPLPGSAVVHLQRGLALLRGLELVSAPDVSPREMIRLQFADDEAILLPIGELASIWPYARDPSGVRLDDADGRSWAARCLRAEREIDSTAEALSELIRARRRTEAPRIMAPAVAYERFVARFPYLATPDQAAAIEDVLKDLGAGHPMDRIVCGDVGFGKTEVALRAAAATVLAGRQVVLVVPTTVLAAQHVQTFAKRFAPFKIEIGHLSRLSTAAEARCIKRRLADGSLKLVIGTTALAADDVVFANLGLVIIDEEQHFGVADKARLSALRSGVHTLTMSATPIPRTMAGAMAGLRDLSVIATPPAQRLPVVTRVAPPLESTLAIALRREHRRRGQSFVICPRIKDLAPMQERLRHAVPELSLAVIHGRMAARDIDAQMMRFVSGHADVLLATNIVENGLDIPRANTILISGAERFGLSQLHQLRGRVGRGGIRAFAYLLTDAPGDEAGKRLAALEELSATGAGFQISARDLDLRGAGDLLSEQQAGHVQIFGPALYHELLSRALSGRPHRAADMWFPELHIDQPAFVPTDYVQDQITRLEVYARLAHADSTAEIDDIEDDVQLRFGLPPPEVSNLFATARIGLECRALGITRLDVGTDGIAARLRPKPSAAKGRQQAGPSRSRLVYKHKISRSRLLSAALRFLAALKRNGTSKRSRSRGS